MGNELRRRFGGLTTAHVADACIRVGVPVRCAPAGTRPVSDAGPVAGRVLPARHAGSVDVFLEALQRAQRGDVLVVDNDGRLDEACVGDLVVAEAAAAGLAGVVIWGLHRDTADIRGIRLPVFSLGALPTGPLELRPRPAGVLDSARVGEWLVSNADVVFGDDDGVLFAPAAQVDDVLAVAAEIRDTERRQADEVRRGRTLREQLRFAAYLDELSRDPTLTFRQFLRGLGGSIEE